MADGLVKICNCGCMYRENECPNCNKVTDKDRIIELEANLARAVDGLRECEQEIDDYIRQEYPYDNHLHERYRQRDYAANPARTTLAELSSVSYANTNGETE